jgi:hypoxanthine phosphoribosyltransferase
MTVLVTAEEIRKRIREMGAEIAADHPEGTLYLIGVLKGAFLFLADLARAVPRPVRIDFIGTSSYGHRKSTSGEVRLTKDLDEAIEGTHVILVEDIADTGVTLGYLVQLLEQRGPKSVRVAALLDKAERRRRPVRLDYVGFRIPDRFVVGYGLDYDEEYRSLADICVLD